MHPAGRKCSVRVRTEVYVGSRPDVCMLRLVRTEEGTEVSSKHWLCVCQEVRVRGQNQRGVLQENHRLLSHDFALSLSLFFLFQWFVCSSKQRIGLHSLGGHTGRSAAISSVLHRYWRAIKTQSFIFSPTWGWEVNHFDQNVIIIVMIIPRPVW